MFLRSTQRKKNGKSHRYFSVVENVRVPGRRAPFQKTLIYLGEISAAQQGAWTQAIRVLEEPSGQSQTRHLFAADPAAPSAPTGAALSLCLADYQLQRPRQYGACWLACELWRQLELDTFWGQRLAPSREATDWAQLLTVSVAYRLIDPGSEWRCHRLWYDRSAMADVLGQTLVWGGKDQLYAVLDRLLAHRDELFQHLQGRWRDLFGAQLDVLLYDLTSTYFEGQAEAITKARHGYSRDHRPDCKQVVLALVVTPEGLPVGYEVMNGNTLDKETLPDFMARIDKLYGKAQRVWLMDRGIPTEAQLTALRASPTPVKYLVGTPRAQVRQTRAQWEALPWTTVRDTVAVKLFQQAGELYVVARSDGRQQKEIAIRRQKLARLLRTLRGMRKETQRDRLLMRWGAAKAKAGRAAALVAVRWPEPHEAISPTTFTFALRKEKLKEAELYDGHYLLRSNLSDKEPEWLWQLYMLLVRIEGVFRCFKNDLGLRPIYHQTDTRVEAHILVCFLAYCLWVTLQEQLRPLAPGLTPRQALDQLAGIQMLDIVLPTSDGRKLTLSRYTQPDAATALLLQRLGKELPEQPPPRLSSPAKMDLPPGAV